MKNGLLSLSLSDGAQFVSAMVSPDNGNAYQDVHDKCLIQLMSWRLIVLADYPALVISDLKFAAAHVGVIGHPRFVGEGTT